MFVNLFSANDRDQLRRALQSMEEIELERIYGDLSMKASTQKAGSTWSVAMLVRLQIKDKGYSSSQYFESVEEMERRLGVFSQNGGNTNERGSDEGIYCRAAFPDGA